MFVLRMSAAKNSRKRRAARSSASAIIAGTTTAPCNAGAFFGTAVSRTASSVPLSPTRSPDYTTGRRCSSTSPRCERDCRAPNMPNCAARTCRAFICLGARSIKTRAAQRSVAGQLLRSLPGQGTRRLARGRDDHRGPALPADLPPAFSAPSEGRQVETSASTSPGCLRQFVRTDRPAMDRARWV